MGKCVYIYKNNNITSKKQAIQKGITLYDNVEAILYDKKVIKEIKKNTQQALKFYYSGSYLADNVDILKNMPGRHSGGTGVTRIIESALGSSSIEPSKTPEIKEFEDIRKNFYKDYGTLIHACIATKNPDTSSGISSTVPGTYDENIQKLFDHLVANKAKYDNWKKAHPSYAGKYYTIDPLADDNMPATAAELKAYMNELYEKLGLEGTDVGTKMFFEVPISYQNTHGHYINGVIECLIMDDEGNVTILDFKTTQKIHASSIDDHTRESYLMQLKMYEAMLRGLGIKGKINSKIVPITAKGKSMSVITENILSTNSGAYYNKYAAMYSKITSIVNKHFPPVKKVATTEELKKMSDIEAGLQNIFPSSFLNKEKEDVFEEYMRTQFFDKERLYKCNNTAFFKGLCYLSLSGDTVSIMNQNKEVKFTTSLSNFIKEELKHIADNRASTFDNIKQAILDKDVEQLSNLLNRNSTLNNARIEHLRKYLTGHWTLMESTVADKNYMLVFQNSFTGDVDIINVIPNVNLDYTYTFEDEDGKHHNRTLLGDALKHKDLQKFKDNHMDSSIANINAFKTMMVFNAIKNDIAFKNPDFKLGQIMCLSSITGNARHYNGKDLASLQYQGNIIQVARREGMIEASEVDVLCNDLHNTKLASVESYFVSKLFDILGVAHDSGTLETLKYNHYISYVSYTGTTAEKIEKLKKLQEELRRNFPEQFSANKTATRTSVTSDIQLIDDTIAEVIHRISGGSSFEQLSEMSATGLDFNNSIRLAMQIFKGNELSVTAEGVSLVGLFQGIDFASPYSNPSDAVREISQAHSYSVTMVQRELDDYVDAQNKAFAKWIKSKQSVLRSKLTQADQKLFINALIDTSNKKFRFKNPFTDTTLTEEDKEYLKYCIWDILRIRQTVISTKLNDEAIKKMNWTELSKNPEYVNAFEQMLRENPESLNIPLRKASDGRLATQGVYAALKGDWDKAKECYRTIKGKWISVIDDRGITPEQQKDKKEHMKRLKAFNMYNESAQSREKRLENAPIESFECNINYLVIDHAYNYVTCKVNQQVLNQTDRMLALIGQIERHTGKDLSKHKEAILKRTAISMYNTNNVTDDYKDLVGAVGMLRSVLNLSAIALRPALFAKEMTVGRLKNTMSAALGYFKNEGITLKDLVKAEGIVFSEGMSFSYLSSKKEIGQKEKVEQVNTMYRIANRDANVMAQKMAASKSSIFGTDVDLMYYTNTRPDWYNRMSIMVAKMIADGSWEAHEMNDEGKLVYNAAKDRRYSVYFKFKDTPPSPSDPNYKTYKEQEARYMWALNEFQKEGYKNPDGSALKGGDNLPAAYTGKEVNSIKEVIGLVYGYFNHEEKSIFQSETFNALFMAFKTYWNSEWRYYFGLPNKNTSRGKVDFVKDAEGNQLYIQEDEVTGVKFMTTNATNASGQPNTAVMDFIGTPTEGIAISFTKCLCDVFTAEGRQRLKDNPQQRNQACIFLLRLLYAGLIAALIQWLITGSDKDSQAVIKSMSILEKSANDLNMFNSLGVDLPIVGLENLEKLAVGAYDSVTDLEGYDPTAFFKNIGAIKDFLPET